MLLDIASHKQNKPIGKIRQRNEDIIISAAEFEFAAHGYHGATMNNIAKRAELPKSNVHYYFKNKMALYAEVLSNILELWDNALNILSVEADPSSALQEYIHRKMQFAQAYPLASRVFAKEILSGAPNLNDYFSDEYREWFSGKTQVFYDWQAQGKIETVDPASVIFLIWSSTQHYADFAVQIAAAKGKAQLDQDDFEQAEQTITRVVLCGLGLKYLD